MKCPACNSDNFYQGLIGRGECENSSCSLAPKNRSIQTEAKNRPEELAPDKSLMDQYATRSVKPDYFAIHQVGSGIKAPKKSIHYVDFGGVTKEEMDRGMDALRKTVKDMKLAHVIPIEKKFSCSNFALASEGAKFSDFALSMDYAYRVRLNNPVKFEPIDFSYSFSKLQEECDNIIYSSRIVKNREIFSNPIIERATYKRFDDCSVDSQCLRSNCLTCRGGKDAPPFFMYKNRGEIDDPSMQNFDFESHGLELYCAIKSFDEIATANQVIIFPEQKMAEFIYRDSMKTISYDKGNRK